MLQTIIELFMVVYTFLGGLIVGYLLKGLQYKDKEYFGITFDDFKDYADKHNYEIWTKEASETSKEIVDKYQQIDQIISIYYSTDITYKETLQSIKEVLEDGK